MRVLRYLRCPLTASVVNFFLWQSAPIADSDHDASACEDIHAVKEHRESARACGD
jgi:hypothetical protein